MKIIFLKYAFIIYILCLSVVTLYLSAHPGHNGDMPFYIVCAIEMEQGSMDGAVLQTQEILRKELPPAEYKEHADRIGNAYPKYFDFYRIKPFYILLVLVFHKFGFSYIHATVVPSLIAFFLTGLSIWRFCIQLLDPLKTWLVSIVCILIPPVLILGRLSTPDSLSCFIMLNALLLIFFGRSKVIWFSLFLLAICTRLDNVMAACIFVFALWKWPVRTFENKLSGKQFAGLLLALIGMAFLVNLTSTRYFLSVSDPFNERSAGYILNVKQYLIWLPYTFLMTLLILFVISGINRGFSWKQEVNYVFYCICAVIGARFLIYPFYEERYFTPFFLFAILTIAFQEAGRVKEPSNGSGQVI
jgi:hypothetical protein